MQLCAVLLLLSRLSFLDELLHAIFISGPATDTENMCRLDVGMERDVIAPAMPDVARVGEQIVHFVIVALHSAEFFNWNMDESGLKSVRIEINGN